MEQLFCFGSLPRIMWFSPIEAVHSPVPHRSLRLHQYSLSSPMPFQNHCFSTVMCKTLPLRLKLSCKSILRPFFSLSSTHYQVTPSHSLNTSFPFFVNSFLYPSLSLILLHLYLSCYLTEISSAWTPALPPSVRPFLLHFLYPAMSPCSIT